MTDEYPAETTVLVGDFFDRGYEPELVWDFIKEKQPVCLLGNHEYKLVQTVAGKRKRPLPRAYVRALEQLAAHGVTQKEVCDFIEGLPYHLVLSPEVVVVHAGIDPAEPLTPNLETNVFGCEAMRQCVRKKGGAPGLCWWDLYKTPPLVIYGHLSSRGGIRGFAKDGRMNSIGVDTGAWATGILTGYLFSKQSPLDGKLVSASGDGIRQLTHQARSFEMVLL